MLSWLLLVAALLATLPIRLAVRLDINAVPSITADIQVYGLRFHWSQPITSHMFLEVETLPTPTLKQIFSFMKGLYQGAMMKRLFAFITLGTGDAAQTALLAGTVQILLSALGAPFRVAVRASPDFRHPTFALSLRCILRLRGGDIIRAGVHALGRVPGAGAPMKGKVESEYGEASH